MNRPPSPLNMLLSRHTRRREFISLIGGAAAAWPLAARAQALPVIGFMSARSPEDTVQVLAAFHRGLGDGGFVDGRNVSVEYRWARGDYGRLPALAAELVQQRVIVLVATGGDASARAAKEATATIPVVFNAGTDPIKAGLVQSFNRPGGNVTGSIILSEEMEQKRFDILREMVPDVTIFGAMVNPNYPPSADQVRDLELAAPKIGRQLVVAKAGNDNVIVAFSTPAARAAKQATSTIPIVAVDALSTAATLVLNAAGKRLNPISKKQLSIFCSALARPSIVLHPLGSWRKKIKIGSLSCIAASLIFSICKRPALGH